MQTKLANSDVRSTAKLAGVRLWEVAKKIGVSDPTLTRKLRNELSAPEKEEYFNLIRTIAEEKANGGATNESETEV